MTFLYSFVSAHFSSLFHVLLQVYSILVLDSLIQIGISLGLNVVRSKLLRRLSSKLFQRIGSIEFYVPGHVLDVVYVQTLCWLGLCYAPLMPAIVFINLILIFFLKLFTLTFICVAPTRVFKASRSSGMHSCINDHSWE